MNTREIILEQALLLFAKKGYDGVSVREIAKAVGVRESALYKHFINKEDIFQKVIEESKHRIREAYISNQVPETVGKDDIAGEYQNMTTEKLCDIAWNLFCLFTKDTMVSNFRKLLMREQFNHPDIAKQYNEFFLKGAVENQSHTFAALVAGGVFKNIDSNIIALHFYGPIFLLFQQYDCEPQEEDKMKEMLMSHVLSFGKIYGRNWV